MTISFLCKCCRFEDSYEDNAPFECPKCGGGTYSLTYRKVLPKKREYVGIAYGENHRWSDALGVAPNQIEAARKIHPGAVFDKEGRMLIRNRTEKKRRLRERGWAEYE
jgi:hypothetical protein